MYKLIFYRMRSKNIMTPDILEISFSVAIENERIFGGKNSILETARDFPAVVSIAKPPIYECTELYLEVETLAEAHSICMRFGYTISGLGKQVKTSLYAEYRGLHECGTLEKAYEEAVGKKGTKSA